MNPKIDPNRIPQHVAIIMDGNGRWAQKRKLPRIAGHKVGAENFRKIGTYAKNIGIKYLTVYAFSTENWKRPEEEVSAIMSLLGKYLEDALKEMREENISIRVIGDLSRFDGELGDLIARTNEMAEQVNSQLVASLCVNYGGRNELVNACKALCADVKNNKISEKDITEDTIKHYLYSPDIPDPDLIIRTGGELRLSNFLMWQSAYSEFYFTDTYWPDFSTSDLDLAIIEYQHRLRRYGGI